MLVRQNTFATSAALVYVLFCISRPNRCRSRRAALDLGHSCVCKVLTIGARLGKEHRLSTELATEPARKQGVFLDPRSHIDVACPCPVFKVILESSSAGR